MHAISVKTSPKSSRTTGHPWQCIGDAQAVYKGGALIGLLFVAISINPERTFSADAPKERQAVASGAFTALVNAFFWRGRPRAFAGVREPRNRGS